MSGLVAAVTGSNKGIGYGIVKELCTRGVGVVYLCSRDVKRGHDAVESLKKEGLNPIFHQLDVTDPKSIKTFADHLKKQHGGLDILINNAGIAFVESGEINYEDAKKTIDVNYRSNITVSEILFPILKDSARVINMSSNCGHISNIENKYWVKRLTREDIEIDDINEFVDHFLESVKNGTFKADDYADNLLISYKVSKIALSALTRYQQRKVGRNISINSVHPGYVQTDMTNNFGFLTIFQSSKAPVYLALDVDQSVKGKYFWYDLKEIDWANPDANIEDVVDPNVILKHFPKLKESLKNK